MDDIIATVREQESQAMARNARLAAELDDLREQQREYIMEREDELDQVEGVDYKYKALTSRVGR